MIGAIIGDIVGSVYEFDNIKTKEFELFADHHGQACCFTDDTVMTAAVGYALMKADADWSTLPELAVKSMRMFGRLHPDCGYGERFGMWLFLDDPVPYNSFGNGSAMRVSPVAYAARTLEETQELSYAVSAITHNHPEGIKGAAAVAECVFLAKNGAQKKDIREHIASVYYPLEKTIDQIRPGYRFDETAQETVPVAIEAFLESEDFEDAIRTAISVGGDSDTVAAITGSIAEAYYGVPKRLSEKARTYLSSDLLQVLNRFEEKYKP